MPTPHAANARATHDELAPCTNQQSGFEALERADKVHKVKQDATIRQNPRWLRAFAFGTIVSAIAGCGGSSQVTSPSTLATGSAVVTIAPLTATVEPITSPGAGWLYRLTYPVHETSGATGATLVSQHFTLSSGLSADGDFTGSGVLQVPRVLASGTITIQSTLSVLTTAPAASHVIFTVIYKDDNGHTGSASADAEIAP